VALYLTLAGWAVLEVSLRVRERLQGKGSAAPLPICAALPLPALLLRIHVEEAEMVSVLGDRYRAYQAQTKRLIPGIW
jgi:protein-S-isoprenylcysteine O-methyltransferase Ste14